MLMRRLGQPAPGAACALPPPENCDTCAPICCPPGFPTPCPARTRLVDAIMIKPVNPELGVRVAEFGCSGEVLAAHLHCIEVSVRRRGYCETFVKFRPSRADADGRLWLLWPERFWREGHGFFEVDIVFDGKQCITILVDSRVPQLALYDYNVPVQPVCLVIPDCAPQVEDVIYTPPEGINCNAECQ